MKLKQLSCLLLLCVAVSEATQGTKATKAGIARNNQHQYYGSSSCEQQSESEESSNGGQSTSEEEEDDEIFAPTQKNVPVIVLPTARIPLNYESNSGSYFVNVYVNGQPYKARVMGSGAEGESSMALHTCKTCPLLQTKVPATGLEVDYVSGANSRSIGPNCQVMQVGSSVLNVDFRVEDVPLVTAPWGLVSMSAGCFGNDYCSGFFDLASLRGRKGDIPFLLALDRRHGGGELILGERPEDSPCGLSATPIRSENNWITSKWGAPTGQPGRSVLDDVVVPATIIFSPQHPYSLLPDSVARVLVEKKALNVRRIPYGSVDNHFLLNHDSFSGLPTTKSKSKWEEIIPKRPVTLYQYQVTPGELYTDVGKALIAEISPLDGHGRLQDENKSSSLIIENVFTPLADGQVMAFTFLGYDDGPESAVANLNNYFIGGEWLQKYCLSYEYDDQGDFHYNLYHRRD